MKLVRTWEEEGVQVQQPYARTIKVFFAPDKEDVPELTFSHALIPEGSRTDYHVHDRGELIYVVEGNGVAVCEGEETPIKAECALWVPAGEYHQMKNTGTTLLKLATVFVPGYPARDNYERCQKALDSKSV